MLSAKIGAETVVRYASTASGAQPECRDRALSLLFGGSPLCMLSRCRLAVFFLILRLSLLLLLRWLSLFFLLCRRSGLRFMLRRLGLGLLFLLRWLGCFLLCRFCLRLVLRRFGCLLLYRFGRFLLRWLGCLLFSGLGLFFVLCRLRCFLVMVLLRERRNSGSQEQERGCGTDDSEYFHEWCLHYSEFVRPTLVVWRGF